MMMDMQSILDGATRIRVLFFLITSYVYNEEGYAARLVCMGGCVSGSEAVTAFRSIYFPPVRF